jgi:hypothetical protein
MKKYAVILIALASASSAVAKSHADYQDGRVVQMDSVPCAATQKGTGSAAGDALASGSQEKASQPLLCQEYTVESDLVTYQIRPRDDKHAALVPVGGTAHFRLSKDKLMLEAPDGSGKEREFVVVSMKPRTFGTVRFRGTY